MAKTKSSTPSPVTKNSADSKSFDAFIHALTSDPEFKRLNPYTKVVDGQFKRVPPKPRKAAPKRDPGGKRRQEISRDALFQLDAIFRELIEFFEEDEGDDDYIMRALVIRGRALTEALVQREDDYISTRGLEGLVRRGAHPEENEVVEIETVALPHAERKSTQRKRKATAA